MSKENNKKLWFKRRRYGYGWIPVTWQGWAVVGLFLVFVLTGVFWLEDTPNGEFTKEVGIYLAGVGLMAAGLVLISAHYGPKPKWRWGKSKDDNPDEDF